MHSILDVNLNSFLDQAQELAKKAIDEDLTCKLGSVGKSEGLLIPRSPIRICLNPKNSNSHGFELHRSSIKGTKLLFKVINANNATHYVKLGKDSERRESSKRYYYIISPRVKIEAIIIKAIIITTKNKSMQLAELEWSRPVKKGVATRRRLGEQVVVNVFTMGTSFVGKVRLKETCGR